VYSRRGRNFLNAILAKARAGEPLRVVNDQTGSPTWARHLAKVTVQLIDLHAHSQPGAPEGLLHLCAEGETTWHGFACHVPHLAGLGVPIAPLATADYPARPARPADRRLDCGLLRVAGLSLPDWREAAAECLETGCAPASNAGISG
jgi:dTDP-4-dehydrorhamnose reductase